MPEKSVSKSNLTAIGRTEGEKEEIVQSSYPILNPQSASNILALIQENLGAETFSILNLPRMQMPGGGSLTFRVMTAAGEETVKELEGILVAWRRARLFWKKPFGSGKGSLPPDCTSHDARIGVGDPGGRCDLCPKAAFGSALKPDGSLGSGQACKEIRQLLLVQPENILPHLLSIPPTSLKAFEQYTMSLLSLGLPYWSVTTKITLEKATNESGVGYARASFRRGRLLTKEEQQAVMPYHSHMREILHPALIEAGDYVIVDESPTQS